ncbi:hypothetical protein quinque_012070 [Culex quinquefasciatus]|uniref:Platelet-derived growth factor (PDGF) family profile domain-containing protein n=1 Tax=Culex pipiens pipiens TaxID=38569 RepID=A0ABD1DNE1_CULPP
MMMLWKQNIHFPTVLILPEKTIKFCPKKFMQQMQTWQSSMLPNFDERGIQYTPHCTILHRCGDDVGCCPQAKTCAASKNSTVELYFFVKAVGSRSTIERLSFINHTECACINRHESINRRTPSVSIVATPTKPPICNCPTYFQRVVDNDNRCFCDCSSSDSQCDQFKRGLEHFSMDNRRCIMNNRCEEPRCEYGRYNIAKGKCPAKKDALSIAFKV